ncbi:uncharacterized protein OCT59_027255 [Rhizophagus irregularis]|uniref:uncharacterized protein n=1 Tax=Rhizophagus irregularis TaxID=588596 RepID=UPI003332AA06|nr:hypothetical protein OCT59_027255 [Rhizophagus irregularis]
MLYLAICYENGEGTEKSLEKAFYWYQKAAENGEKEAMFNLASSYYNNYDVEKMEQNTEKAFYWYQKAAENGYERAMFNLANIYYWKWNRKEFRTSLLLVPTSSRKWLY